MYGVIAAIPTPVDETGEPQQEAFIAHAKWLLENGCDGLNILGSTGEANSFDMHKRRRIMTWASEALDNSKLMVGTGTPSLSQTIKLTQIADDLGYGVALVLPPYYYKPLSDDDLIEWYSALHHALEDHKIKIYFYNFPQMTGLLIPVSVVTELNKRWPERFCGIKDSSGDLDYCRELTSKLDNFAVFPSSEVALGEAGQSGFAGCISATTNQTSELSAKLWDSRNNPDAELVAGIEKLRAAIGKTSLIPSVKHLVAQRTGDDIWENLVPPFRSLNEDRKNELAAVTAQLS